MNESIARELAAIDLGDVRLNRRAEQVLARLLESPLASPTAAMHGWAEMVGAYRLLDHPECTLEAILQAHRQPVLERVRTQSRVLLIQDTTELDYSSKKKQAGRGPLGEADRQGYFLHTQWAVSEHRLPLGSWDWQIRARDPEVGIASERKKKPIEEKESYRWLEGYRHACALAEQAPGVEVISCADREGDVYEVFVEWQQHRQDNLPAAEWLIRCNQNRAILQSDDEAVVRSALGPAASLIEEVRQTPAVGGVCFEISTKEQFKKIKGTRRRSVRQGRRVRQEIRVRRVSLRPPDRPGHKLPSVSIWVVMATEVDPPPGQDPINWTLLTSKPVENLEQAVELIQWYQVRWEIEVFHRVLKSGCKVEELQFKKDTRIKPIIALYAIVAWRILYLTKLGRECPDLPCDVVFAEEEWKSICLIRRGPEGLLKKPSLQEMILLIASFGGHIGRRSDGPPGPEVMWRGMQCLRCFALAWRSFGQNSS
jgi:Transposase Tn5 dimerisation domain/Transposase DNA-binding